MEYSAQYLSPIGPLLLASDGENLTGLYMNREVPDKNTDLPVFHQTAAWLNAYFRGEIPDVDVPIKLQGTEFQIRIWEILKTISADAVMTYGEIAKAVAEQMGKEKMSAQAVGQAVGKNPVSIIIPCHRVIGAQGKLTGYGGGMENKIWLLRHEGWQIQENRLIQQRRE